MKTNSMSVWVLGAVLGWCAGLTPAAAQYTNLHAFSGDSTNGIGPYGEVTLAGTTLYGMTMTGGESNKGVVFQIQTDGTGYTNLYSFAGSPGDGAMPYGSVTLSGTSLYGMTMYGGVSNMGTIFKLASDGSAAQILHYFTGSTNDGSLPQGSLTLAGNTLYGMTTDGGAGGGVVFKINTDGSGYTNLRIFANAPGDGYNPAHNLTLAGDTLYGMTRYGGAAADGTIFKMNTNGSGFSILHSFTNGAGEGRVPFGSLTLSGTNLYGMANGGATTNGVIFRLNTDGSGFTKLHDFTAAADDGADPNAALTLLGTTLYGTTVHGGTYSNGALFKMNTDGTGYTNLHSFTYGTDNGVDPWGSLTLSGTKFYGLTAAGGLANYGVLFMLQGTTPKLFFQDPTGQLAAWALNTTGGVGSTSLMSNTGGWALKAAGDMDGDGIADLLFQTAAGDTGGWFMNLDGTARDARFWWNTGAWELKASADYEATGRAQVFFQTPDGNVAYWKLDTTGAFQSAVVLGNQGDWKLKAAGDLDHDGKAELFWQKADGTVAIWFHDGPGGSIRGYLAGNTGEWALCGLVDVDGDAIGDLIWQTPDSRTGGWFMNTNGTARSASFWWPTGGWKLKAAGR